MPHISCPCCNTVNEATVRNDVLRPGSRPRKEHAMGNYPARDLRGVSPERPSSIPSTSEVGEPFAPDNREGRSAEDMAALNAEFTGRWNAGEWLDRWYVDAVKRFRDEVTDPGLKARACT